MKSSNQKKSSLLIKYIVFGLFCISLAHCTSSSKVKSAKKVDPTSVVDTVTNTNHSSPNHAKDQSKIDSLKKVINKTKKK